MNYAFDRMLGWPQYYTTLYKIIEHENSLVLGKFNIHTRGSYFFDKNIYSHKFVDTDRYRRTLDQIF